MRTRTQDQDLEELDKEDINSDERNGLLNGPVPDIDTLEIGITRKEMGELFNCMNYSKIYKTPRHTYTRTRSVQKLTRKILEVSTKSKAKIPYFEVPFDISVLK